MKKLSFCVLAILFVAFLSNEVNGLFANAFQNMEQKFHLVSENSMLSF